VKQAKFHTEKQDNLQDSEKFQIGSLVSTCVRIVLTCLNYIDNRLLVECENHFEFRVIKSSITNT
jgi:hypothetical protein